MADEVTQYTIAKGDTLSAIARQFYGNADLYTAIAHYNGIKDPDRINAGDKLKLPGNLYKKKDARRSGSITILEFDAVIISNATPSLEIQVKVDPADTRFHNDLFVLSTDDGSEKIEKGLKKDGKAGAACWNLVFDNLDDEGVYTLTVFQAPNKEKHTIFKSRKYGEWKA